MKRVTHYDADPLDDIATKSTESNADPDLVSIIQKLAGQVSDLRDELTDLRQQLANERDQRGKEVAETRQDVAELRETVEQQSADKTPPLGAIYGADSAAISVDCYRY